MFWKSATEQNRGLCSFSRNRYRELCCETLDKRQPMAVDVTSFAWGQGSDEPQVALACSDGSSNDSISRWGTFESAILPLRFNDELYHNNVDMVFFAEAAGGDPLFSMQFLMNSETEGSADPQVDGLVQSLNSGFRPTFVVLQQGDDLGVPKEDPTLKDVAEPAAKALLDKAIEVFRPKIKIPFRRDNDVKDQNPLVGNLQEDSPDRPRRFGWMVRPKAEVKFSPLSDNIKDWNSFEDFMQKMREGQIAFSVDFELRIPN